MRELVEAYTPSDETLEIVHDTDLIAVMGPSSVGKNTVIQGTGLPKVISYTTRPEEERDNGQYHFVNDRDSWQQLIEDLYKGNFVQAVLDPMTGEFYGSTRDDYEAGTVNLIEIAPKQYDNFKKAGQFRSLAGTYISVPGYSEWLQRYKNHGDMADENKIKSMEEAESSLTYARGHKDLYFILNESIAVAARALREFAANRHKDERMHNMGLKAARVMLFGVQVDLEHLELPRD